MAKVLLLNPPSRKMCMRDYCCSKISKGSYCYHPVDFIVLSGTLSLSAHHQLVVVDAIAERLDVKKTMAAVIRQQPDVIIFLTGAVSFEEDGVFLAEVKRLTGARMIGLGDLFLGAAARVFERWSWLDAALLDFTTKDILRLIEGPLVGGQNAVVRTPAGEVIHGPVVPETGNWDAALPRHELFLPLKYTFPFARQRRFSTVLTNVGCPYACPYCPVSFFAYKERSVESIRQELVLLQQCGVREIVFKDQTFGAGVERNMEICDELRRCKPAFGWTCFLRPELASPGILEIMASAGCHTVIFGVESGDEVVRKQHGRGYSDAYLKDVFCQCRQYGLETVATFVMGLPGETVTSLQKTIFLSKELGCDYASFNIFVPAYGTALRRQLEESGAVGQDLMFMDSGISSPCFSTALLKADDIWKMHRRAVREFYGRPGFLMKKIVKAGSLSRLLQSAREGCRVLARRRDA